MTSGTKESGGWWQTDAQGNPAYGFHLLKTWSGSNDPVKHRVENAYTMTSIDMKRTKLVTRDQNGNIVGNAYQMPIWYAFLSSPYDPPYPWGNNDELALLSKLTENIRGHNFNLAIFLAELPEAINQFTNSTAALIEALDALRRRDWPRFLRALPRLIGHKDKEKLKKKVDAGDISGAWLGSVYGWQPLVNDIYEAMRAIEHASSGPRSLTFHAQKTLRTHWIGTKNNASYNPTYEDGVRTRKYKVTLTEKLTMTRALGLQNPAAVVWEKMKWSFVFDWFIPVGTYLDTLGVLPHLNMTACRTDWCSTRQYCNRVISTPTGGFTYSGGEWLAKCVWMTRSPNVALTVPLPTIKTLKQIFSPRHLINAIALAHQVTTVGKKLTKFAGRY